MGLLWKFRSFVYRSFPRLPYQIVQLQGRQQDAGPLTILTSAGERFRDLLAQRAFSDEYEETRLGRIWRRNLHRRARAVGADILVITGIPRDHCRRYESESAIFFPHWVLGEIDMDTAMKRMETSTNIKNWVHKFRKNDLQHEVTRDSGRIYDFYHSMHLPYVEQRFGKSGRSMSPKFLRKNIHRLELTLVRQGSIYIAGNLLFHKKNGEVESWVVGLKDGDPAYLRTGAGAYLYYRNILEVADRGFTKLSFGWSRSFLDDGVLQHKKIWGMRLVDTYHSGSLMIALNDSPQTRAFFQNTPLIGVTDNKLTGMLFVSEGDVQSEHDLIQLHRQYHIPGMDRLRVLAGGRLAVPDDIKGDLTIESADHFFRSSDVHAHPAPDHRAVSAPHRRFRDQPDQAAPQSTRITS